MFPILGPKGRLNTEKHGNSAFSCRAWGLNLQPTCNRYVSQIIGIRRATAVCVLRSGCVAICAVEHFPHFFNELPSWYMFFVLHIPIQHVSVIIINEINAQELRDVQ